jgi:tRNA (guanine6-N2)-methyltransferase
MLYLIQTMPGLAALTWREIEAIGPTGEDSQPPRQIAVRSVPGRNDLVLVDLRGGPKRLLNLRTAEDVFVVAGRGHRIAPDDRGLRQIYAATKGEGQPGLALDVWRRANGRKLSGTYRIVARSVGDQRYTRRQLAKAVSDAVSDGWPGKWREVEEDADLEIWATLVEAELYVAVRLSDASMRQRGKIAHLPASLRPALAGAMILLTRPSVTDVFLDPMAGAGTLVTERVAAGGFRQIFAGDNAPAAMRAMQANLRGLPGSVNVRRWDAAHLPLETASVDKIAVNMPFGRQISEGEDLGGLYRDTLREMARVLKPGGRLIALVGNTRLLDSARAHAAPALRATDRHRVMVLGTPATIVEHLRIADDEMAVRPARPAAATTAPAAEGRAAAAREESDEEWW